MGQKTSKNFRTSILGQPEQEIIEPTAEEIKFYKRIVQKYEKKKLINEEKKTNRRKMNDPRRSFRKPTTVDQINEQGTVHKISSLEKIIRDFFTS